MQNVDETIKTVCGRGASLSFMYAVTLVFCATALSGAPTLESGFANPPMSSRVRAYWWWLNGNVTSNAITRDLEEMKAKGFGGALICDAGGAEQDGNDRVPHGPDFFSPEWRALYKHTLAEAHRLGLEMSLNIQSGWNLGGPMVKPEDAAQKLVWTETRIKGPGVPKQALPEPKSRDNYYRDLFVVACPVSAVATPPLQNWQQKGMHRALSFSAPDTSPLFAELPDTPGEAASSKTVVDLTGKMRADGTLEWNAPEGEWQVLRFGCTIGDHSRVSTSSDGWKGYALDVLNPDAFSRYWDAVVEPLIRDAGPLAGNTLRYLHTDSWEVEAINWTPTLRQEFRKRRGYDFLPFLPALTGRVVDSRRLSNRFLNDFRKTLGDLAIDGHFRVFRDRAHKHGLLIHPESGGPHAVPIDAQRCLGWNDAPMSEFWAWSWRHRVGDDNRFFVKQPASAAHTYGRRLVLAEGFTTIGPHWQETIWDNLKPSFDKAICEGLNMLVWHAFVCSPEEMGLPGQQYFAGTHFNPNTTWWNKSGPFLEYMNRCQFLMQQGTFVADVCYYYGDHVPNFSQRKHSDPAKLLPGYDYDVITEELILSAMKVRDGNLVLPRGMSYRLMVLPNRDSISLPVLRKLQQLVAQGASIVGPRPTQAISLQDVRRSDRELPEIANALWGNNEGTRTYKKGRVISGKTAREVLALDGVAPDFEFTTVAPSSPLPSSSQIDYIHRRVEDTEVYFVMNRTNSSEHLNCTFRVAGKAPELWDPVTGERRFATSYSQKDGRTSLPLEFNPCGAWFIVFREPAGKHPPTGQPNHPTFRPLATLEGPWTVHFDPRWNAPDAVQFDQLRSWTDRPEPGIKHYSGAATYRKSFDLPAGAGDAVWLDLGDLRELAEVRLNGQTRGIVWAPPFRVKLTGAKPSNNLLEIEVVNFWPNRLIGDSKLPANERLTRTNIRKFTPETPLMPSGLFGPVRLIRQQRPE